MGELLILTMKKWAKPRKIRIKHVPMSKVMSVSLSCRPVDLPLLRLVISKYQNHYWFDIVIIPCIYV